MSRLRPVVGVIPPPQDAPQPRAGAFEATNPDDGRELMLAWDIPPEDWEKLKVKTTRPRPGSGLMELLWSCLPSQWSLDSVAMEYGPGTYKVTAGPGPYRGKNVTITVSREYANAAGWEPAPPMTQPPAPVDPQQMMAARTFAQATAGPVDAVALAQMIQTAVNTAIQQAQPKAAENPLDLILKGFEMAQTMTTRSLEAAKGMMGVTTPAEAAARTWADVALELGPTLLGTLQTAMAQPRPTAPTPPPQPQHPENQRPMEAKNVTPLHTPPALPDAPPQTVAILRTLRMYAPTLRAHLESETPAEDLAHQLAGLLGPDLDESITATAAHVSQHGPGILGHAAPYMATDKAAAVVIHLSAIINTPEQTEAEP